MSFSCGQDGGHGKRVAAFNDGLPDGESDSLQGIGFLSAQQRGIANRPVVHHVKERLGRRCSIPKFSTTASKVEFEHPSCSASPSRNSIPGYRPRASSTISDEKSTPVAMAPRAAAAAAA